MPLQWGGGHLFLTPVHKGYLVLGLISIFLCLQQYLFLHVNISR